VTVSTEQRNSETLKGTGVVTKALGILEHVGLHGEATLSELIDVTGLPRSTLHRLLKVLVDARFLQRSSQGTYRCTLKLWRIGALCADYDVVRERIQPVLRSLAEQLDETAQYGVYEDGHAVYIAKADAAHPLRAGTKMGERAPGYASATGKAVLAWRDDEDIVRVAATAERLTPSTIVGAPELLKDLEQVRERGYSVARGEWYEEVWAVAAPLVQPSGLVESAIGVAGPAERVQRNLEQYTDAVVRAARSLSEGRRPLRKLRPHHAKHDR